ncbi:MAG: DUF3800 domain-containing protein [Pseudomonadota bacterium]|nr:DUF3800 domain-containing protein [Pseudomonadota bacterium]
MKFLFLDDSKQKKPARQRMGSLVGVGGVVVDADSVGALENNLNALCAKWLFPVGEPFKWSPSKADWFREGIKGEERDLFFLDVLSNLKANGAQAVVSVCDASKKKANSKASDHEVDALLLCMERFHTSIRSDTGFVMVAKPSGGDKSDKKLLGECIEHRTTGTEFVDFNKIAHNPVLCLSRSSRLLQSADLIVSVTTAMVAGLDAFAGKIFPEIKEMLLSDWRGLKGAAGLKIHPDILYENIYHWLLDEEFRAKGSAGYPLPASEKPYSTDPLKWS